MWGGDSRLRGNDVGVGRNDAGWAGMLRGRAGMTWEWTGMMAATSERGCGRLLWNGALPSWGCYGFTVMGRLRAFFDSCLGNEMLNTPFW